MEALVVPEDPLDLLDPWDLWGRSARLRPWDRAAPRHRSDPLLPWDPLARSDPQVLQDPVVLHR